MKRAIATKQGVYFLATGIWPLVHVQSFQAVTGRKTDNWTESGSRSLAAEYSVPTDRFNRDSIAECCLAKQYLAGNHLACDRAALALTGIDVVYVSHGVISKIYSRTLQTQVPEEEDRSQCSGETPARIHAIRSL